MKLLDAVFTAQYLMCEHGLDEWEFQFNNTKTANGCCYYQIKRICLSKHFVLLNDDTEVILTILHEIAHALTPGHGHDDVWKAKVEAIGGVPVRCYNDSRGGRSVVKSAGRYAATCPGCSVTHYKHKRPAPEMEYACKKCGPENGPLSFKDTK